MKTFEEVWAEKEKEGYQYGSDALEQVRFGWSLGVAEVVKSIRSRARNRARNGITPRGIAHDLEELANDIELIGATPLYLDLTKASD